MPETFTLDNTPSGQITAADVDAAFAPRPPGVDPALERNLAQAEKDPRRQKPFVSKATYLNPNIPGHPEYNDQGKSPLDVLRQEKEAQQKKATAASKTFTLDDEEQQPKPEAGSPKDVRAAMDEIHRRLSASPSATVRGIAEALASGA